MSTAAHWGLQAAAGAGLPALPPTCRQGRQCKGLQQGLLLANPSAVVQHRHRCCAPCVLRLPQVGQYNDNGEPGPKLEGADLAVPPAGASPGLTCREYALSEPLAPGATTTVRTAGIFTHVLRSEPAQMRQKDPHRVVYKDGAQIASPYKVESQVTEVGAGRCWRRGEYGAGGQSWGWRGAAQWGECRACRWLAAAAGAACRAPS